MDTLAEQLKQMEKDGKELVKKLSQVPYDSYDSFEYHELVRIIKAHDIEVGKLLGVK